MDPETLPPATSTDDESVEYTPLAPEPVRVAMGALTDPEKRQRIPFMPAPVPKALRALILAPFSETKALPPTLFASAEMASMALISA